MHRFFITEEQITNKTAAITGEDVAHISRVLRLQPGDSIALCDGQGGEYTGCIRQIEKEAVLCALSERLICAAEPKHKVTLYQCLPKSGKMETIIQKCVELGVFAIVPTVSSRCVVKPDRDFEKKRVRYQRVAYEAAKQSRRGAIPQVLPLTELPSLNGFSHELTILAYEDEHTVSLKMALSNTNAMDIGLIIGPEGGFAPEEAAFLREKGAVTAHLGPRILRTETAGMACLAMLLYDLEG